MDISVTARMENGGISTTAPDYPEVKIRVVVRWEGCGFVTRRPPYWQELTDEPSPLDKWDCEHFEVIGNEFDN